MQMLNDPEAEELVRRSEFHWHQRFQLSPTVFSPGVNDIEWLLRELGAPASFDGLSVLDIGTTNGAVAFIAERRGAARVVATDILGPEPHGFDTLHAALESKVEFVRGSIYELPEILGEQFDVVFFLGVLYHLRHPLLGLDAVRRLTRQSLYLETAIAGGLAGAPGALFFRKNELADDGTNWFAPNIGCLSECVASAGFDVQNIHAWPEDQPTRGGLMARAVDGDPEFTQVSYEVPLVSRIPAEGWRPAHRD